MPHPTFTPILRALTGRTLPGQCGHDLITPEPAGIGCTLTAATVGGAR
ncbi:hypothetical protein [Solwaraspora sp. WMMA2065]|nr:hypothetical protein [Solwaraspora sp. WMMA2065]WJK33157.1 hypothetical protein O7610_20900 [Solwaraspora sp. WMMA2065]